MDMPHNLIATQVERLTNITTLIVDLKDLSIEEE